MLWVAVALATLAADSSDSSSHSKLADAAGDQWLATSPSFVVRNHHSAHDARQIAQQCERWRSKLQKYWTAESQAAWTARCTVTVHSSTSSYLVAVGQGG